MILEYKGIHIFYSDRGKGNPIVLLHGFLENSNMWEPFIPSLSEKNRVICIDLLGHGKTGCLGYIHKMEHMAECVTEVLNQLKINHITLIGHSMGGYVALAYAKKHAEKVKGLCLMNSTAKADSVDRKKNRDRAIQAVKQNHKTFIRVAISNLFGPNNIHRFSEEIKHLINEAIATPLQGIVAALEGMKVRPDSQRFFRSSEFKKLMIISKKDPVLNYESLIDEAEINRVKVIEFSDGHMSYIENKDDFLQEIVLFVENI